MSRHIVTPTADDQGLFTWLRDTASSSGDSEGSRKTVAYPITPPAPVIATAPSTTNCDVPNVHQRFPLSCVICHRRKVKCDRRVEGCGNCIKAGAGCIYPQAKVSLQRFRTRPSPHSKEATNRERELERKLKALEAKVHLLTNTTIRSDILNDSASVTVELQPKTGAVQRHGKISMSPLTVRQVGTSDTVKSATVKQVASNRPITDRFWANFTGEVSKRPRLFCTERTSGTKILRY